MQECPWCHTDLSLRKLILLSDRLSFCEECGKLIRNSRVRDMAAGTLAVILGLGLAVLLSNKDAMLVVLVLYPFSKVLLARPLKVEVEEYLCQRCKRSDVGYRRPGDPTCADCLDEQERSAKKG
jgi:hypothetical protein